MTSHGRERAGDSTDHSEDPLLADLTPAQRAAVEHGEGPLLILAGPGSGKTRVITRRIAHLLRSGAPPWSVLALTFTNKAAGEMRARVQRLLLESRGVDPDDPSLPPDALQTIARGLTVTTFHALCARLLRRYLDLAREAGEHVPGAGGLTGTYSIYDSADQAALMKRTLTEMGLSTSNWPPGSVLHAISKAKNRLIDAEAWAQAASDFHSKTVAKVWSAHDKALRAANAVDFDDLLMLTVRMLQASATVCDEVRSRWRHLMIDEYQDTNHAQFVLASLLSGTTNICVVGDPDQSIYGWRGADISNILEFEAQYEGARVIALGDNFRSGAPILALADGLIRRNARRKHKDLIAARRAPAGGWPEPEASLCRDERHEALNVARWLASRREDGVEWREMAVAYRTNSLSRVMEDALRALGSPYVIARGTAFYEREEVKDALAYLRVVANGADDVSLARIVNKPARGIGAATLERVREWARQEGVPMLEALRAASLAPERVGEVTPRAAKAMGAFVAMVDGWTGGGSFLGAEVAGSLRDLVERVVRESGLEKAYAAKAGSEEPDDEARAANLAELVSSAAEFEHSAQPESDPALDAWRSAAQTGAGAPSAAPPLLASLRAFLESVALIADADKIDPASGAITLLTLHAAKGLEFDSVAIIGLEEGLLPHSRSRDSVEDLEEERRLLFVGITRAKERLLLTTAKYRTIRGLTERTIPSQFLDELASDAGAPGGGGGSRGLRIDDRSDEWADEGSASWERGGSEGSGGGSGSRSGRATDATAPFPVGAKVRHPQFGVGKVKEVSGGIDARARVEFPGIGAKTLVLRYARLERVS